MRISSRICSADFRAFSADFRTFPADFRAFPADFRAFSVSAFWLRKLQTRKSGKEAVTHCPTAIGDERPETELSMTGRVNCKLCSCASKCTTNAHSLLKAISVKFSGKCTLTLFFCMYGNFSTFGGLRYASNFMSCAPLKGKKAWQMLTMTRQRYRCTAIPEQQDK